MPDVGFWQDWWEDAIIACFCREHDTNRGTLFSVISKQFCSFLTFRSNLVRRAILAAFFLDGLAGPIPASILDESAGSNLAAILDESALPALERHCSRK